MYFLHREQPVFSTRAHVFQIDPATKKSWLPCSKQAVTVSFYYDPNQGTHRIISVDGTKVRNGSIHEMGRLVLISKSLFIRYSWRQSLCDILLMISTLLLTNHEQTLL